MAEDNIDVNITGSGQHSRSALHRAIEQKDRGTIALLLQHPELNPNVYNHIDWTPLYDTVSNRDLQIVELLLTRADLEVNTPRYPPLFYTAQRRHLNIVKQLIKVKGIDINLRFYGLSPLQASIKFEHMDIAKVLQNRKSQNYGKKFKVSVKQISESDIDYLCQYSVYRFVLLREFISVSLLELQRYMLCLDRVLCSRRK